MELSNLSLAYLIEEMRPQIEGGFINKAQQINQALSKIRVHTKDGGKDIVVTPAAIFIAQHSFPAEQSGRHQFFEFLRKHIYNKKVISLRQHSLDRVVVIELPGHFLIIEIFGNGNMVLTNKEFDILAVKKPETWKDRTLKKGHKYAFPASKGISPLDFSEHQGVLLAASQSDIIRALVKEVNISPTIAEEALFRLKIDKTRPAKELSKKELAKIAETIRELYTVSLKKLEPVKAGAELLPFPLKSVQGKQEKIESMGSELDGFYAGSLVLGKAAESGSAAGKKNERAEHSYKQLLTAKEKMEKLSVLNARKGELLYANFTAIQPVMDAVKKALEKKVNEKEIMQKVNSALEKSKSNVRLKKVDAKAKAIALEIDD